MQIGVGLYYNYCGHQIHYLLKEHPRAKIMGVCGMDAAQLTDEQKSDADLRWYQSLEEMVADPRIEIISLCSPNRRKQVQEAIYCMEHGKHVYAEKPCAMTEEDLEQLVETSRRTGRIFHEQAGTGFQQPCLGIRKVVNSGVLGEIVQVFAQKSYPYHEGRPQDEDLDGGLIMQNGIHAVRFIEHGVGLRIKKVRAIQTAKGNPHPEGNLQMASSFLLELENGGIGSMVVNYLNQEGIGHWGNEHLRVFGTKGMVEFTDGGERTRLIVGKQDLGPIDTSEPVRDYFDYFLDEVLGTGKMPISLEEELHPTRIVIRARASAEIALPDPYGKGQNL